MYGKMSHNGPKGLCRHQHIGPLLSDRKAWDLQFLVYVIKFNLYYFCVCWGLQLIQKQPCKLNYSSADSAHLECVCHAASTAAKKRTAPMTALALWLVLLVAACSSWELPPPIKPLTAGNNYTAFDSIESICMTAHISDSKQRFRAPLQILVQIPLMNKSIIERVVFA